jgi:hypothetical protein
LELSVKKYTYLDYLDSSGLFSGKAKTLQSGSEGIGKCPWDPRVIKGAEMFRNLFNICFCGRSVISIE